MKATRLLTVLALAFGLLAAPVGAQAETTELTSLNELEQELREVVDEALADELLDMVSAELATGDPIDINIGPGKCEDKDFVFIVRDITDPQRRALIRLCFDWPVGSSIV